MSTTASTTLRATTVSQSAGGQELDNAQLEWLVTGYLTNRTQPAAFARMVDVLLPDADFTRVHLGDYVTESERVAAGESLAASSQLRPYHFGAAYPGQRWKDVDATEVDVEVGPHFNPKVDQRILPNRSSVKRLGESENDYLFCHPEALLTSAAQTESNQTASLWTLIEAVLSLCKSCNINETFIKNPTRTELATIAIAPSLEDVRLPFGRQLPEYLDLLLHPLGYNWFVEYDTGFGETAIGTYFGEFADSAAAESAIGTPESGDSFFNTTTGTTWTYNGTTWEDSEETGDVAYNKNKPKIVVFEKGVGTEKTLNFQAPNATLALASSNVNQYSITRNIGDSVNEVTVVGDVERAEVTIELVRGWPATDDSLTAADLDKSDSASSYESKPTVWRLWVANEAGDYTDTRTEITEALDLSSVFSRWVLHRRQALDPFTFQGEAGAQQRRQMFVEYTDDGGSTWQPAPSNFGQPFVLPDQIGIIFQGDIPPEALILAGTDAGVRITCVVEGDARLKSTAAKQRHSANSRTVPLVVDAPDKFQKHWVQATGDYASVLSGATAGADTRDDTDEIEDFAEKLRDDNEVAEMQCEFVLPGLHLEYDISDLLTNIVGREVSLNMASGTAPEPRYPQIVKREFRFGDRIETVLTVDRGTRVMAATFTRAEA